MKSTVIPIWHDIAKRGDWSVGSILQWQAQSCEIWLPTRKCTGRLKAMFQQVLKFCLDLGACYQLHLCIIAALLRRHSGETPQGLGGCPCLRVCLCWNLMLEQVHGKNHQHRDCTGGMSCCSTAKCQFGKLPQFCTAEVPVWIPEGLKPWFPIISYVSKHFLMKRISKYCNSSLCTWS